jgi:RimJ/RimL family protein N-acetyltransferase
LVAPPYRIETQRLVLRCWQPTDAPALKDALDSSLEHLQPWMHWATGEPSSLDDTIELLRGFRGLFDTDQDFVLGIFERDESRVLGGTGLHTRHAPWQGPEALEIGYWLRVDAERKGLASEAAAALTRVAFERCGVDRVEVRVDPANERSRRVPERLGFTQEATLRRRLPGKLGGGDLRDAVIFSMFATDFTSSPCASVEYRAFDAAGRPLDEL